MRWGSRGGLAIVPEPRTDYRGVDHYAGHSVYNGLALYFLDLATDEAAGLPGSLQPRPLPAERPQGMRMLDPRGARISAISDGSTWIGVHAIASHLGDVRYGIGLLAAKQRTTAGWVDLQRPLPLLDAQTAVRVGPCLVRSGRRPACTRLAHATVGRRTITLTGPLPETSRAMWWQAELVRGGVSLRWRARRGDHWRYVVFRPSGDGANASGSGATWVPPRSALIQALPGLFHSAADPDIDGTALRWRTARNGQTGVILRAPN